MKRLQKAGNIHRAQMSVKSAQFKWLGTAWFLRISVQLSHYQANLLYKGQVSSNVFFWLVVCRVWSLQELIQISSRLKMDFGNLIQIDSRLKMLPEYFVSNHFKTKKNFPEFWFKSTHDSKTIWNVDSNRVMTQWFEWTVDFADLFWVFTKFRWPFLGIRLRCLNSNQLMTRAVSRRPESIELMTQAAFQEVTQNHLMTQVDSPGIDSD